MFILLTILYRGSCLCTLLMAVRSVSFYTDKVILAPMVRAGRLPMRLMAIQYGADIVYSEEHIDLKMLKCKRVENSLLDTVDFISPDGKCQFRTCKLEKDRVVFQMGTANPVTAVKTAKMLENDVAAIDVNMGCPKNYSIKGGMGAALLTNPEMVRAILEALVREVKVPVTCKIRLLPSRSDTLHLVQVIERTGVSAIAVHGRYKTERPEDPCHVELIREVAQSLSIPVLANGGSLKISSYKDIMTFKEDTGCDSVMVARSALNNPSIFRKEGPLPIEEVVNEFVKLCLRVDETLAIIKYCLSIMLKPFAKPESPNRIAHMSTAANTKKELSEVHNLLDYYQNLQAEREKLAHDMPIHKQRELDVGIYSPVVTKRSKLEVTQGEDGVYELHVQYDKRDYPYGNATPKTWIMEYATNMKLPQPTYKIIEEENRLFKAIITLGNSKYRSTVWSTSKRNAEHSAALVALTHCGVL